VPIREALVLLRDREPELGRIRTHVEDLFRAIYLAYGNPRKVDCDAPYFGPAQSL
jgi:hypothetical protein